MSKKVIFFFITLAFFSSCKAAFADLSISEIFYSTASKEWVEIYNGTDSNVDITQYKILDAGASVNGHSITPAVSGGSNMIPAHAYGVIAKDITSVNATNLFHAALGISPTATTSDTVILKSNGNIADTVPVSLNSAIDGNSLQLLAGSWISATPTPGAVNQATTTPTTIVGSAPISTGALISSDSSNDSSSTKSTATASATTKNKTPETLTMKVAITAKNLAFVSSPVLFQGSAYGFQGEKLMFGKYFWNFGDGDSKEINLADSKPFTHTYFYPGDYIVTLEYYQNAYSDIPDASDKMTITVTPADISISKVGDQKDFFVELTNNTDHDADISYWVLESDAKSFTFPKDTIIASQKKMMISPSLTNFSIEDENSLKLNTPEGRTVFDYAASVAPEIEEASQPASPDTIQPLQTSPYQGRQIIIPPDKGESKGVSDNVQYKSDEIPAPEIPVQNLGAAPILSGQASATSSDAAKTKPVSQLPIIIAFGFIGAASGAVYFIRKKKVVPGVSEAGDDFEILDE